MQTTLYQSWSRSCLENGVTNPKVSDHPLLTRVVENDGLLVSTEGEHISTNPCQNKGVNNLVGWATRILDNAFQDIAVVCDESTEDDFEECATTCHDNEEALGNEDNNIMRTREDVLTRPLSCLS